MKWIVAVLLVCSLFFIGCTSQSRAKRWGGSAEIKLPVGTKLEMVTWKNDDLWILYRQRKQGEMAGKYTFKENSSYGVLEGKIIIQEK